MFGPGDVFPYAPERKYTPTDAGKEQLFALRDFLGFDRNVIVQATCHGADNRALVDALLAADGRARGVATVRADVSDGELADLHAAGVRGIRFNFVKRLVDPKPDAYYRSIVDRVAALGWHVVLYFEAPDLEERWDLFTSLPTYRRRRPHGAARRDAGPSTVRSSAGSSGSWRDHGNVWSQGELPGAAVGQRPADVRRRHPVRACASSSSFPTGSCGAPTGRTPT